MKKIFKALNLTFVLLFISLVFIACDEEYSVIESGVLSEENFNFEAEVDSTFTVLAYSQNLSAQQIDGLPSNLLGFYEDPIYGTTTASIVAQVLPNQFNPNFGLDAKIEAVELTIPYFSTQIGEENGEPIYKIDSLYVKNNKIENNKPIKLSVYENRYFLRDFTSNSLDERNYFSNANISENNGENIALTKTLPANFEAQKGFQFCDTILTISDKARVTGNETTPFLKPALQLDLAKTETEKTLWETLILSQQGNLSLSNPNEFLSYFKGLFIKAEAVDNLGSMVLLNLLDPDANITITISSDNNNDGERETIIYRLNFFGNILNPIINNYNPSILPTNANTEIGDEKLFLKGTSGALAVLELFNDDETKKIDCNCGKDSTGQDIIVNVTELDCFKKTYRKTDDSGNELEPVNGFYELKQILNEAHLIVYEDSEIKGTIDSNNEDFHKHDRLYIYNLDNNTPISDYESDPSTINSDPLLSRSFGLGIREEDENGNFRYNIKLTDHLNDILLREGFNNSKLGLIISNNVNISQNTAILNNDNISGVPATALISPRGTVLYGSAADENKKIKLKLFYTGSK